MMGYTWIIPCVVEIDRYIGWPIFLDDTDISVSVSIISVSAKTILVSALVLITRTTKVEH